MKQVRNVLLAVALVGLALAGCSSDSKSGSSTSTTGVTVATTGAGTTVNVVVGDTKGLDGPMTMTVSPASVPAGKVTFVVKNTGTIEHEMVVLKTDTAFDKLAIDADGKVSEDTSIGEVAEFAAGTTQSVTLDVTAGQYALVCNIAKHYGMGMRVALTAT
jgi:uncharacterized cupredoxin-like copper-binding protein